jgi:membrane-associated protease RseP (regulator of RpoE activity)
VAICGTAREGGAQSLNWDGQTGALVTPYATVATSSASRFGRPLAAFAFMDAGDIVGQRFQISFTVGIAKRFELGYTKSAVSGDTEGLAMYFDRGFQNIHGKVQLSEDREGGAPAIAVGARFAWQVSSLTEAAPLRTGDIYVAVTKAFAASDTVTVLVNGGVKFTNAALLSLGGNAADWCACVFGSGEATIQKRVTVGAEVLMQPQEIELLGSADIPPTFTVFGRVSLVANRLSVLGAWVRLAGVVAPGVDLRALNSYTLSAAFRF